MKDRDDIHFFITDFLQATWKIDAVVCPIQRQKHGNQERKKKKTTAADLIPRKMNVCGNKNANETLHLLTVIIHRKKKK